MITISKLNAVIFVVMFCFFVFASKALSFLGIKITGIEYIVWFAIVSLLAVINFRYLSNEILVKRTYFLLLIILLSFCIANYFVSDAHIIPYLQGTFFTFLFAVNFILFYNIKIEKKSYYFMANSVIFILSAIIVVAYLERIFVEREYDSFYLRGIQTVTKDTGLACTLFNMNIILCLGMFIQKRKKRYLYIAMISFITITLLLYLKAIAASLVIIVVFALVFFDKRIRKIMLSVLSILLFALLIILGKPFLNQVKYKQNLYFGKGAEATPRIALYIAGIQMAKDYFPFGSGQGTFGSYPVGKKYSPIYYKYKLNNVYGLGPNAVKSTTENFLFDTYWSHIIGEMGFIASFFYLWLWFFPVLKTWKYMGAIQSETKAFSFIITLCIITIFIESFALSIPEQLPFIMLYAGLGAITYKLLFTSINTEEGTIRL